MNKKITTIVVATAFFVGGGFGAASASGGTKAAPAAQPQTITKTVEVSVPGPATNTTPQECLDALDLADQGFSLAGDGMTAAGEGFTAVGNYDVKGLTAATDKISTAGDKLRVVAPQYKSAREACKAAS